MKFVSLFFLYMKSVMLVEINFFSVFFAVQMYFPLLTEENTVKFHT